MAEAKEVMCKTGMKGFVAGNFISGLVLLTSVFHFPPEKENRVGEEMPVSCSVLEKMEECVVWML